MKRVGLLVYVYIHINVQSDNPILKRILLLTTEASGRHFRGHVIILLLLLLLLLVVVVVVKNFFKVPYRLQLEKTLRAVCNNDKH